MQNTFKAKNLFLLLLLSTGVSLDSVEAAREPAYEVEFVYESVHVLDTAHVVESENPVGVELRVYEGHSQDPSTFQVDGHEYTQFVQESQKQYPDMSEIDAVAQHINDALSSTVHADMQTASAPSSASYDGYDYYKDFAYDSHQRDMQDSAASTGILATEVGLASGCNSQMPLPALSKISECLKSVEYKQKLKNYAAALYRTATQKKVRNKDELQKQIHFIGLVLNGSITQWLYAVQHEVVGAKCGKETHYMRVECSAHTIHGRPILEEEYLGYLK